MSCLLECEWEFIFVETYIICVSLSAYGLSSIEYRVYLYGECSLWIHVLRTSGVSARERSGVPLPGEGLSCSHLCALWYLLSATRDGRDAGSTTPRRYVVWRGLTFL